MTPIDWSFDWFRTATRGRWLHRPTDDSPEPRGVGIDSRSPELYGRAFIAIRGDRFDGHAFLPQAEQAGARLAIVDRHPRAGESTNDLPILLVEDARAALGRLAHQHRLRLPRTRIVAVTGSAGKTTVKRLIHAVLASKLKGRAAARSFNNDIGVPLTLLAAESTDEFLVVEVGMNAPGEIAALASLAEPDLAVITSIGHAHIERLGSLEAIAAEKASLLLHVRPGGASIVNADAPLLQPHLRSVESLITFGTAEDADLVLTDHASGEFIEVNGRQRHPFPLPGRHNALNALAAIAVARRLGLSDEEIGEALARVEPEPMRFAMETIPTADPDRPIAVVNDAYNANPESMIAGLETFLERAKDADRRIVVLGDMLELGEHAEALHRMVADRLAVLAEATPIDRLFLIGRHVEVVADHLAGRPKAVPADRILLAPRLDDPALAAVVSACQPGDAVFLKGSRGVGLEAIADRLRGEFAANQPKQPMADDVEPPAVPVVTIPPDPASTSARSSAQSSTPSS